MPRHAAAIGLTLMLVLSAGCMSEPATTPSTGRADAAPVVDEAPYRCELVPEKGVRAISGLDMPLEEFTWGDLDSRGGCSLRNEYSRFSLNWSDSGGEEALERTQANFASAQLSELPADLGKGLIAFTGGAPRSKPYVAFVLFRCGEKKPWIGASLSQVAKERNVREDLTSLLRIARDRYGELRTCTPEGIP